MQALAFLVSFILAFLLFAVQPMATKMVLPTLGGTPAVWNTAMFTFQFLLLAGYAYAHGITAHVKPRFQLVLHGLLGAASCLLLPLAVSMTTSDAMLEHPAPHLVAALLLQVGLPFFLLAATQPLLQSWVSRSRHPLSESPYVLYSASNLGSFAGLIGYVVAVEPLFAVHQQSQIWSVLYVAGLAALLLLGYRLNPRAADIEQAGETAGSRWRYAAWIGLAFLPSSLSLGVTTYITTDVASVPLLWVIPLSLYLLSFVDAFRARPIFVRFCQRFGPLVALAALILYTLQGHRFAISFPLHLLAFAMMAFALHGWLALLKPGTQELTRFYLCLSFGGALGGMLNGLLAPMIFREAVEYPLVLMAASVTAFIMLQRKVGTGWLHAQLYIASKILLQVLALTGLIYVNGIFLTPGTGWEKLHPALLTNAVTAAAVVSLMIHRRYVPAYYACVTVLLMMLVAVSSGVEGYRTLFKDRNFFGVERVYENAALEARYNMHDTTLHGVQSLRKGEELTPFSYYTVLTDIFAGMPQQDARMAVVGLGIGSIKCANASKSIDYYEINPMVKMLAEDPRYFTHLRDCPGEYRILMGDGRIRLAQQKAGSYGAIMLDAFSSDAIPAHLLTQEAMQVYMDKLAPNGLLFVHTTNRHIDLWPLLGAHADAMGLHAYGKFFPKASDKRLAFPCYWVVIAKNKADIAPLMAKGGWQEIHGNGNRVWTDQYTNLLAYLKVLR